MTPKDLTQEKVKELFEYKDGILYWKIRPSNSAKSGSIAGYVNKPSGYIKTTIKGCLLLNHRIIFLYHNGYLPDRIDHIDGDITNNRIENLREVTHSQNLQNTKTPSNNKSGVKGVSWSKHASKWYAQVRLKGKVVWCKYFSELDDAAEAVRQARVKYHEEYTNHG